MFKICLDSGGSGADSNCVEHIHSIITDKIHIAYFIMNKKDQKKEWKGVERSLSIVYLFSDKLNLLKHDKVNMSQPTINIPVYNK